MNRERAEKLLAALIFDDLDEASKAELQAYLQTDDDLRDRLADMRMAAKLACDAVKDGPDPVLSEHRLAQLKQLAKTGRTRGRVFTMRRFMAVAAVLAFGLVLRGPAHALCSVIFVRSTDRSSLSPCMAAAHRRPPMTLDLREAADCVGN